MSFFTITSYVIVGDKAQIKELYDILYPAAEKIEALKYDGAAISLILSDVSKALDSKNTLNSCMSLSGVKLLSDCELKFLSEGWKGVSEMGKIIHNKYPEMEVYYRVSGFDTPDNNQYTNDLERKYYSWGYNINDIDTDKGAIWENECDKVWDTKYDAFKYLSDKYNKGVFLDEKGWADRAVYFSSVIPCNDECISFQYPMYRLTISSFDNQVINEVREIFQKYALGTFALSHEAESVSYAMNGKLNLQDKNLPLFVLSHLSEEKGEDGVTELGLHFFPYDYKISEELNQKTLETIADALKAKWDFTISFKYTKIDNPR